MYKKTFGFLLSVDADEDVDPNFIRLKLTDAVVGYGDTVVDYLGEIEVEDPSEDQGNDPDDPIYRG